MRTSKNSPKPSLIANNSRSNVRERVEHVFGFLERSMGGKLIRSIGVDRAKVRIGMMNLGPTIRTGSLLSRAV